MSGVESAWGQIFILGYQGTKPSREFLNLVRTHQIGGIIFFERNIASSGQLKEQIVSFRKNVNYPLFFMIDQEGGKVNRIKKDFPLFPSNKFYGEKKDFQGARGAYQVTATELKKIGINVNLAPVADLISTEESYIAERSFGSVIELVCRFTELAVKAIHSSRLFACAKHFPGIGSLKQDPHKTLPEIVQSREEFWSKDFQPFRAAIDSGVELVMTTHVNCPGLDPNNPATFSRRIVSGILRQELKFEGLTITDDMEMGGITHYFDVPSACERAFVAGHDLILLCHSLERQKEVLEHFDQKIKSGEIPKGRLDESLKRINLHKQELTQDALV